MLALRLKTVMPSIIGSYQGAFIPGRSIKHNTLLSIELFKHYDRSTISPRCALKIDLRKAFDTISHSFLIEAMKSMGLPPKLVHWIKVYITSVHYSLNINGSLQGFFKGKRGLRQGCPLSPYLFSFAIEYLSRILKAKTSTPNFNFHPNCHKLGITHLSFADDIIIFCRGDIESVRILKSALDIFSCTSGCRINSTKSCIIFGGVPHSDQIAISELLNCKIGTLPTKYLGLPICSKQLSSSDFQPLVSRITTKILSWTARHLSYAGRLQLISSVLFSMQVYWCNSPLLPVNVVKQIEGLLRNYLWSGKDNGNRNLVAWSTVCQDKGNGGLGIKEILGWNKACVARSIYELYSNSSNLWSDWINACILKGGSIWSAQPSSSCSWSWRAIIDVKDELLSTSNNTRPSYRFVITPSGLQTTKAFSGACSKGLTWQGVEVQTHIQRSTSKAFAHDRMERFCEGEAVVIGCLFFRY